MNDQIELGDIAKDSITGFEGVVTCVAQWLHGCRRLTLQPQELRDGKPVETSSFDEPQLVLVAKQAAAASNETGGPRPEPSKHAQPVR